MKLRKLSALSALHTQTAKSIPGLGHVVAVSNDMMPFECVLNFRLNYMAAYPRRGGGRGGRTDRRMERGHVHINSGSNGLKGLSHLEAFTFIHPPLPPSPPFTTFSIPPDGDDEPQTSFLTLFFFSFFLFRCEWIFFLFPKANTQLLSDGEASHSGHPGFLLRAVGADLMIYSPAIP